MSQDLRLLIRQLHDIRRGLPTHLANAINHVLPRIEHALEQEAPRDKGELASSIHLIPAKPSLNPRIQIRIAAPYGAHVQFGTSDTHADDFVDRALDREAQRAIDAVVAEVMRLL